MPSLVNVAVHPSQFPDNIRRDLLESLSTRRINHKFHYDSVKQTQKWLALHQAYSPSRTDADCAAAYERSFAEAAGRFTRKRASLLGLGCGGGQKDARLLRLLRDAGKEMSYTPLDVSTAMVLVARQAAIKAVPGMSCFPVVCDLASETSAEDLGIALDNFSAEEGGPSLPRLITFFGMIPNFEPQLILPRLARLVRSGDTLLFSANLAPGPDYAAGVTRISPLYDNALTRDWLMAFLVDLGVEASDGDLCFVIEEEPPGSGLKRVAAYFRFASNRNIQIDEHRFEFRAGESIRLFFSYRHTPSLVRVLLAQHGLRVLEQWITASEEEGVFLVSRD
jgi:L-histidine Nalpha-methyltransferase